MGKVDPLIVLEATNNSSSKELALEATKKARTLSSSTRLGGLGRFLSRRRSLQKAVPAAAANNDNKEALIRMPDRREDNGTSETKAKNLEECFELEERVPSFSPKDPEPLVVKVEIGTRDIPLEECKMEYLTLPETEQEPQVVKQPSHTSSFPSLDEVLMQLAFRHTASQDLSKQTVLADKLQVATRAVAAVVTTVEEEPGEEEEKEGSETAEEEEMVAKPEGSNNDGDNMQLALDASKSLDTSFLARLDLVRALFKTISCTDGCSFDWESKQADEDVVPLVKSFEEYDDDMDVPVLLKSENHHLDVHSIESDSAEKEDIKNTRGLEVMLTLPEV